MVKETNKKRKEYLKSRIKEGKRLTLQTKNYEEELNKIKRKEFVSQPPQRNFPVKRKQVRFIQTLQPAPALSREQDMLQELFNGERTFGTGNNLPKMEGVLRSGGGLMNNGDVDSETASMFGYKKPNIFGFIQEEGGY